MVEQMPCTNPDLPQGIRIIKRKVISKIAYFVVLLHN